MGVTMRYVRVDENTWGAAMQRAQAEGTNLSELIRGWLDDYANEDTEITVNAELGRIVHRLTQIRKRLRIGE